MNKAIQYIICAGASLALGFGAGYFFRDAQENIKVMQKQAEFEANAVSYASENFKQINSDLYGAHQSAQEIERSLEQSRKELKGMIVPGLKGSAGPPSKTGFNDCVKYLFDNPKGKAGSSKVDGLDDLFKDKEEKKK